MTRDEIKILSRQVLMATLGTPTEGDVFGEDALLNVVTDRIAAYLDCYYVIAAPTDITAGTAIYEAPLLYSIKSATVASSSGSQRILSIVTTAKLNRLQGDGWINAASADIGDKTAAPDAYMIALGPNQYQLWPTPSVTRSAAISAQGLGIPGTTWAADDAQCPLPDWTQSAVAYGLALWRCVQHADDITDVRVQRLTGVYIELLTVAAEIAGRYVTGSGLGRESGSDETRTPKAMPLPIGMTTAGNT